jgi:hypothetical protein
MSHGPWSGGKENEGGRRLHNMGIWIASMLMLYASVLDSHQEQATELQKRDSIAGSVVESTSDEPVKSFGDPSRLQWSNDWNEHRCDRKVYVT